MNEEWRKIEGFGGYDVSAAGHVQSYWKFVGAPKRWAIVDSPQRLLVGIGRGSYGHLWVVLCDGNGERSQRAIHQLVLEAFVGPCPSGLQVCHYDGDATNNHLSNLRYDTPAANTADGKRYEAWMSRSDVVDIRQRFAKMEAVESIAADYGVGTQHIRTICSGKCYQEYPGPIGPRPHSGSLSVADLIMMIRWRNAGLGYRRIGARLNVSTSYVCYIFQGKRLPDKFTQARARMPAATEEAHDD